MTTTEYTTEVRHDGRLHTITIPELRIPMCSGCGEKVFTEEVDEQVNRALRLHLKVFAPNQIRDALNRLGLSQKEVAASLGIAEATLSRWLNETQIQIKAMDRYLRVYFAFPDVRAALSREFLDPGFGTADVVYREGSASTTHRSGELGRYHHGRESDRSWQHPSSKSREGYRKAQEVLQKAGSAWGTRRGA